MNHSDLISQRPYQQDNDQDQDQDDNENDTPKRRLGKVDRGREACNECRRHKIRCHPHADDPQHLFPCSRCERMNLNCEFAKHNRGRKRKRPLPLLAGNTTVEDRAQSYDNPGPSNTTTLPRPSQISTNNDHTKNQNRDEEPNHPRSFGDPRFPFISNNPDAEPRSHHHHHHHGTRSTRIEDDYRPSKQMSLRHMIGEESSDEGSTGDDHSPGNIPLRGLNNVQNGAGESHKKSGGGSGGGGKGKAQLRGPELVDDPIRAGFVEEPEARALFHLFITHFNGPLPLLDASIHTHDVVREQSSFLYTAILCVTSRYLSSLSPDGQNMSAESAQSIHQQILVLARDHMTWAFAEAITNIDVVRAMVILTMFKAPDDDKAGYHMNRAILLGKELQLGRIPSVAQLSQMNEEDHRRLRIRQRVWLCLFVTNSIFNMQFQQPMLIAQSDPLVATAHHWLKRSRPETVLRDTQLVCSVELRRKFLKYRDLLVGTIPNEPTYGSALSLSMLTRTMNQDWDISCEAWIRDIIDVGGTSSNINKPRVWTSALRLNLNLLIVNQTLRLPPQDQPDVSSPASIPAFNHCLNAATTVLLRFETLDRNQLTFASDTFLHFALYAATLLSSLCRGQHPYKFETPEIDHCRRLITKVADALDASSAYPSDSPTLHAWYLRKLCQLLPLPANESSNAPIPNQQNGPQQPPLSVSSSDISLPSVTQPHTSSTNHNQNQGQNQNAAIDPLLQNVTTTMPIDPALTTVIGNELDFFLGDFPWVGSGLDATIGNNHNQNQNQNFAIQNPDQSQGNHWGGNNDLMGMFGNTGTQVNGIGGTNLGGLTNPYNQHGHGHGYTQHPNQHNHNQGQGQLPLEMSYGSGLASNSGMGSNMPAGMSMGMGMNMGMGMGMGGLGGGGMGYSHVA